MNKAMKRSLLYTFILLLTALALTATGVYAWYTNIMAIRTSDATDGHANVGMRINLLFDRLDPATFTEGSTITFPDSTTAIFDPDAEWGTPANPYIISLPRHMINLYALQESGYFFDRYIKRNYANNDPENGAYLGTSIKPYFLVCDTAAKPTCVNGVRAGESIKINPVGNDEYPFIGAIGGAQAEGTATAPNNKTSISSIIANFTVEAPDDVTDIGLFGKIGYLGKEPDHASEGQTFTGSISGVSDLLLYDVKIVSEAKTDGARDEEHLWESDASNNVRYEEDHHVGILAGHIEYASITNISVYYSSDSITAIDVNASGANYLSDSGIIGLVYNLNPETRGNSIGCATGTTIAGAAKGAGNEWGASIDMKTMFNRLRNTYGTVHPYVISRTTGGATHYLCIDENGGIYDSTTESDAAQWSGNSGKIYTTVNGTKYYLYRNSTTLRTTTNENTGLSWDKGANNNYLYDENYYISYRSGSGTNGWYTPNSTYYRATTARATTASTESFPQTYVSAETVIIDEAEGTTTTTQTATANYGNISYSGNNNDVVYYQSDEGGSFVFAERTDNAKELYAMFHGKSARFFPKTVTTITKTAVTESGFTISNGGVYLNAQYTNAAALANANSFDDAAVWQLDAQGHLFAYLDTNPNNNVSTGANDYVKYYLNASNTGALSLSTSGSTVWTKAEDAGYEGTLTYQSGGLTWYMRYNGGTWDAYPASTSYNIHSGNYYFGVSGTDFATVASANAAAWFVDGSKLGTLINGTVYYLVGSTDGSGDLSLTNTRANGTDWNYTLSGGTVTYTAGGRTWHLFALDGELRVCPYDSVALISQDGYYLNRASATAVNAGTDASSATAWNFNNGVISTYYNGNTYYLNASGSTVSLSTTQSTTWTKNNDGTLSYTYNGAPWYLVYSGGWKALPSLALVDVHSGTDYLSSSGPSVTNSAGAPAYWIADGNKLYTVDGTTIRYLRARASGLDLVTAAANGTEFTYDSTNKRLSFVVNGTTYYVIFNGTNWTVSTSTVSSGPISSGNSYLNATATAVSRVTNANQATQWTYDESTGRIYTTINNTTYYLRGLLTDTQTRSTTNLTVTNNDNDSGTTWDFTGGNLSCDLTVDGSSVTYHLVLENNTWKLMDTSKTYYTIHPTSQNTGYYLTATNTTAIDNNVTSEDNATLWASSVVLGNAAATPTISTIINGQTYYLNIPTTGDYAVLTLQLTPTTLNYYHNRSSRYNANPCFYKTSGTTEYFINMTNSGWVAYSGYDDYTFMTLTNRSFTPANVTISGIAYETEKEVATTSVETAFSETNELSDVTFIDQSDLETHLFTPKQYQVMTKTVTTEAGGHDTYFPLVAEDSALFAVDPKNTGYVVGGSHASYQETSGDVRFSAHYTFSDGRLTNAVNGNTYYSSRLEVLTRTYLSGWQVRVSDLHNKTNTNYSSSVGRVTKKTVSDLGLVKYDSARDQLGEMFGNDGYNGSIYGVHFMDAAISMDNMITAPKVVINEQTYYNYQMPEDCIDFRLRTKGFVNFFAGTYYVTDDKTNNCFFSLNQIFRNSANEITAIKRISKIYGVPGNEKKPYIYLYGDGNYSDGRSNSPVDTDGYVEMFDTDWIERPSGLITNAMYYFEIPVNAGEYALGSVEKQGNESERYGAYLCYLDIGTSAADRTSMLGTIDFVYDNKADKIVVVPDTSENDTSLNYYVPSLAIMYTKNNDENDSVKIDNFTVKVTRTIGSVNDANATLNATFGGSDAEHLDVIPQHSGGDTINKSTA